MSIKAVVFDAYGTLFDVQSVAAITEETFPGHGDIITQIWRIKQLEYSWLRSLMGRYEDFSAITRDALTYTLRCLGLPRDEAAFARIMEKYLHLDLYPDARAALNAMRDRKLAILSNGSSDMLNALVRNSNLDTILDATISVDAKRIFKPHRDAYVLIEEKLGVAPPTCYSSRRTHGMPAAPRRSACASHGSSASHPRRWRANAREPSLSRR